MMPNSPVIFWYWNGNPTPDIICRQLRQIRDAGFTGVSPHPMPENFNRQNFLRGMTLSYPGETFFQRIRLVVKECRRLGLFVTLYDEGGWPSGSANGAILDKHPEYAAQVLTRDRKTGKCRLKKFEFRPSIFCREATDEFLRLTHEQYYRVMPEEFGETIQGIFTDEPRPVGRVGSDEIPWAPDVEIFFAECCGGEPEQFYPMLFPTRRLTPEIRRIRALYITCMTEIARRNYFRPIADWCRKHRIAFEGHLNGEDEYSRHAAEFGNYLQLMDEFDVPGADAIWRQIFPGEADGEFLKFTSSAAIRNHRSVAQCEFGNVYGHGTTTPELNALANEHLIRGINRLSLMPFLYRGGFDDQLGCCTDYSPRSPLWRLYPALHRTLAACRRIRRGSARYGKSDCL